MIAYCYASGQIGFGRKVPDGALGFVRGPAKTLRAYVEVRSRHAYDGETLLVPGIPEARSQKKAMDALKKFQKWLKKGCPERLEVGAW